MQCDAGCFFFMVFNFKVFVQNNAFKDILILIKDN